MSQSKLDKLNLNNNGVSHNEIKCNHTINRVFKRLLKNDTELYEDYKTVYNKINIHDYEEGKTYEVGDLVWFQDTSTKRLFLLKCIRAYKNKGIKIVGSDDFTISQNLLAQGWHNENDYLNMVNMGIATILSAKIMTEIESHQNNKEYHPYGKISKDEDSENFVGNKLLYYDLRNLDSTRATTFFPLNVKKLTPDNVIIDGYYREYDNNILEYDIIFRFGQQDYEQYSSFGGSSVISANNVVLKSYSGIGGRDKYENEKYFYNSQQQNIFNYENPGEDGTSRIGLIKQMNRNDYVNTYFAKISFPKNFANTNYSIYTNTVMSQCSGEKVVPSQNEIIYCNKARGSMVAINVTYPNSEKYYDKGSNAKNGGLISNSFHCKIIGVGG